MIFTYKLYNCDVCFFHTNNKKDYEKHATTNKHSRACMYAAAVASAAAAATGEDTQSMSSINALASPPPPPHATYLKMRASSSSSSSSSASSSLAPLTTNTTSTTTALSSGSAGEIANSASFICLCGKHYKTQYGLRYHKRKCAILTPSVIMTLVQDNQELRKIIVAQNKLMIDHNHAFQQQIADLIPKMAVGAAAAAAPTTTTTINHNHHNTQNNFNLNIFLNEKCKDALNMSDFINSLKVTLDDLLITRERGLGESIGRILVQGLSTMDVYKRPIHCTDLKRDTMYVKDKEVWERDEQNAKIKGAIDQLSYKQIITIDDWKQNQPDIAFNDDLQLKYNTILLKVLSDPDEKDARKIIRCVSKETLLDKLDKDGCM